MEVAKVYYNEIRKERKSFLISNGSGYDREEFINKVKNSIPKNDIFTEYEIKDIKIKDIPNNDHWVNLRFLIDEYSSKILNSVEESEDKDYVESLKNDRDDLLELLNYLDNKNYKNAFDKYTYLDTIVRDSIPEEIRQFLSFYKEYESVL